MQTPCFCTRKYLYNDWPMLNMVYMVYRGICKWALRYPTVLHVEKNPLRWSSWVPNASKNHAKTNRIKKTYLSPRARYLILLGSSRPTFCRSSSVAEIHLERRDPRWPLMRSPSAKRIILSSCSKVLGIDHMGSWWTMWVLQFETCWTIDGGKKTNMLANVGHVLSI